MQDKDLLALTDALTNDVKRYLNSGTDKLSQLNEVLRRLHQLEHVLWLHAGLLETGE